MPDLRYRRAVEAAAERMVDTGVMDLVDLAAAAASGFGLDAFTADAAALAETLAAITAD